MKKFNKKKILYLIIFLIAAVSIIVIFVKNRYETPEIDYFEVFGEKYKVENPKKKVYMLNMKSAKIEYNYTCPMPFKVVFKNGYVVDDGVIYTVDGESMAYYYFNVVKKNDKSKVFEDNSNNYNKNKKIYWSEDYDFYIMVRFDEPLEKDSRC